MIGLLGAKVRILLIERVWGLGMLICLNETTRVGGDDGDGDGDVLGGVEYWYGIGIGIGAIICI